LTLLHSGGVEEFKEFEEFKERSQEAETSQRRSCDSG